MTKNHRAACPAWSMPGVGKCDCPEAETLFDHCQDCGRKTQSNGQNDGYSECCGERIVRGHDDCYHKGGRYYEVD